MSSPENLILLDGYDLWSVSPEMCYLEMDLLKIKLSTVYEFVFLKDGN